ncbi:DinB family protein [Nocardioides ferulae]|uniref:DinB family protein n=1 Tax=Nocardioides ferulae TaxID=2340821 RepID=UPI000EAC6133|nr:DinB family protein [Nocardioides ferulae]
MSLEQRPDSAPPSVIEPDVKDWTWVLERPCPECGLAAGEVEPTSLAAAIRANAVIWTEVLTRPSARARPRAGVWSPLEYACHVRDVHRIMDERVASMLETDEPRFANWDQDQTAVEARYAEQDPAVVGGELVSAAERVAARYAAVSEEEWVRRGLRGDGAVFTVAGLGRYHLHDVVHHVHDVGGSSG